MSDQENQVLPEGWLETTLGDVCQKSQYGWTTRASDEQAEVRFLRTTDITSGRIEWKTVPFCEKAPEEIRRYRLRPGDIVISRAGSVGYSAVIGDCPPAVFASYLIRFVPYDRGMSKYLGYFLQTLSYWRQISEQAAGIALQNVNAKKLSNVRLPLAPSQEQEEIVSALDAHLTRLDAAVAALERVRANLKRYRASVLKAACEGQLVPTEAELARREGRDYEPADVLLERILQERRARWEAAELAKLRAKGDPPTDDRWNRNYKEPEPPDTSGLPELPEGWVWTSIEQIADVTGGLTKNRKRNRYPVQLPYLRVANVYADELRLDDVQEIGVKDGELERVLLEPSDMLVVEGNGSPDQIGRVALWDGSISPCVHQNHLIKVRYALPEVARFALLWLLSRTGRQFIAGVASSTSGLYTLSLSKVRSLPIPLPPLAEQARITSEVDREGSIVDQTIRTTEHQHRRADRLRQSILKRAFEGLLVPQDPTDEPASVLLERIRAERETGGDRTGRGRAEQTALPGLG